MTPQLEKNMHYFLKCSTAKRLLKEEKLVFASCWHAYDRERFICGKCKRAFAFLLQLMGSGATSFLPLEIRFSRPVRYSQSHRKTTLSQFSSCLLKLLSRAAATVGGSFSPGPTAHVMPCNCHILRSGEKGDRNEKLNDFQEIC